MPCKKVRYKTELEAKIALATLIHQDKEGHHERRCYRCPFCRTWHLTKQEPKR